MSAAVFVRGIGVVCALGRGVATVQEALAQKPLETGFAGPSGERAAYPADFRARRDLPDGLGRRLGRQPALALAAILEAVEGAADLEDAALVLGTAHGAIDETVDFVVAAHRHGERYASPTLFASSLHNAMAGAASRALDVRGPTVVLSNGDVSFESALVTALAMLRAGHVRRAIVGAADSYHAVYGEAVARLGLRTDSTEPTDPAMERTTCGHHAGEGAGALLLEVGDSGDPGVRVVDASLSAAPRIPDAPPAEVRLLSSGDRASARRHADVLARWRAAAGGWDPQVAYPAARFGAFGSLGAVATVVEAARLATAGDDAGPVLLVAAPYGAPVGTVLLAAGP